uniref:Uncharacterized protein n=1 Tax=Populus alba TaxID=43335 RepID=A0A4V6AAB7_POPAL|nr:hypothetical protein D5086_0000083060 [Populus alba]
MWLGGGRFCGAASPLLLVAGRGSLDGAAGSVGRRHRCWKFGVRWMRACGERGWLRRGEGESMGGGLAGFCWLREGEGTVYGSPAEGRRNQIKGGWQRLVCLCEWEWGGWFLLESGLRVSGCG